MMKDQDIFQAEFQQPQQNQQNWFVSYSDVVTLLLCFFIIFYSIEKKNGGGKGLGNGTVQSQIQEISKVTDLNTDKIISLFRDDASLKKALLSAEYTPNSILLDFKNQSFFLEGSYRINKAGSDILKLIVPKLKVLPDQVRLQITGHTDPKPTKRNMNRKWQSNLELSALRAISVFNIFKTNGFPADQMSIKGYGPHAPELANETNFSLRRKISILITKKEPPTVREAL